MHRLFVLTAMICYLAIISGAYAQDFLEKPPPSRPGSGGATINDPVTETFCKHISCRDNGSDNKRTDQEAKVPKPKPKDAPEQESEEGD